MLITVAPGKINMEPENLSKTIFLFNPVVFRFHVTLPGRNMVTQPQVKLIWTIRPQLEIPDSSGLGGPVHSNGRMVVACPGIDNVHVMGKCRSWGYCNVRIITQTLHV